MANHGDDAATKAKRAAGIVNEVGIMLRQQPPAKGEPYAHLVPESVATDPSSRTYLINRLRAYGKPSFVSVDGETRLIVTAIMPDLRY